MTRSRLVVVSLSLALGLAGCQTAQPQPDAAGDDFVRLTAEKGMPMADFVKLGQSVTGKVFTFSKEEARPITFVGTLKVKKSEFMRFMETMLRIKGFEIVPKGAGKTEVLHVQLIQRNEVVKLEHVDTATVLKSLKALAKKDQKPGRRRLVAVAHASANSILMSGSREQIAAAKDVIARMDRPHR